MNVETVAYNDAAYPELTYSRTPFPVAVLDGKPWWSTSHVQHFLNGRFAPSRCEVFTSHHVGAHKFPFDGDELSHVISSLAALELAGRNPDRRANKMVAGWLRKRDAELRTAAPEPVGSLYVVREDGPMPDQTFYMGPILDEWKHWDKEFRKRYRPPSPASSRVPLPPRQFTTVSTPGGQMGLASPDMPPTDPEELRKWNLSIIGRR